MTQEQFMKALELMSNNHTTELVINQTKGDFVGNLGSTYFTIHIKSCCPAVINTLHDAGYMLSMSESGLSVTKYEL